MLLERQRKKEHGKKEEQREGKGKKQNDKRLERLLRFANPRNPERLRKLWWFFEVAKAKQFQIYNCAHLTEATSRGFSFRCNAPKKPNVSLFGMSRKYGQQGKRMGSKNELF